MKRTLAVLTLTGFLLFTGSYIFVYLFRAFRVAEPNGVTPVYLWHGDPMTRAILVAVLFVLGLVLLLFLATISPGGRSGSIRACTSGRGIWRSSCRGTTSARRS